MRVAIFQNDGTGDPDRQLESLQSAAREANRKSADLLVCPELFMSGYNIGDHVEQLAEPCGGPFMQAARKIAADNRLALVYGYPERDNVIYNSAAVIGADGAMLGNFRKLHLAPGRLERARFSRGDRYLVFEMAGMTAAVLICYDVEFPEAVRSCVKQGADLIIVPTALREQYAHLTRTLIPTRAFENRAFVVYANHAGTEDDWHYCGLSCVASPDGHLVDQCGVDEQLLVVELDPASVTRARESISYIDDLRHELYR